jgi:hypothetical protein
MLEAALSARGSTVILGDDINLELLASLGRCDRHGGTFWEGLRTLKLEEFGKTRQAPIKSVTLHSVTRSLIITRTHLVKR